MIVINIKKAKDIAHDIRRASRGAEFEPLDALFASQIPGTDFTAIEAERQLIRDKYEAIQLDINTSISVAELSTITEGLK